MLSKAVALFAGFAADINNGSIANIIAPDQYRLVEVAAIDQGKLGDESVMAESHR